LSYFFLAVFFLVAFFVPHFLPQAIDHHLLVLIFFTTNRSWFEFFIFKKTVSGILTMQQPPS
jgi:hypothetical protein